jgi:hypothetical protein
MRVQRHQCPRGEVGKPVNTLCTLAGDPARGPRPWTDRAATQGHVHDRRASGADAPGRPPSLSPATTPFPRAWAVHIDRPSKKQKDRPEFAPSKLERAGALEVSGEPRVPDSGIADVSLCPRCAFARSVSSRLNQVGRSSRCPVRTLAWQPLPMPGVQRKRRRRRMGSSSSTACRLRSRSRSPRRKCLRTARPAT